ncbi:MAG TPA: MBL fold metallo-hydrolase [Planctomycetota bacterium]|nr:MBL fold metallo-hydrolase [Planctomycetota bacterium]
MSLPALLAVGAWRAAPSARAQVSPPSRPAQRAPGNLDVRWIRGSADCATNADPPIQAHRYDEATWILRQSKCVHFEAPFLYLLLGKEKAFLQDTGATASEEKFPVRETVERMVEDWRKARGLGPLELVVTHSHAHGDHVAGDGQFRGRPRTTVLGTRPEEVAKFFGIPDWPKGEATFDLGGRTLRILPIPGHEASSVAVYDESTGLLLTGDTLYPGRLYVRDWEAFRASIGRLADFARRHPIFHVLGTHVEMTRKPGVDFPVGAIFQPDEHPLELAPAHLFALDEFLRAQGERPDRKVFDDFIVQPLRRGG